MTSIEDFTLRDLAEFVGRHLATDEIEVILVGGACVSIYSDNKHQSLNIDLISYESGTKIRRSLKKLGFSYNRAGHFENPECRFIIEFVAPPAVVGKEIVTNFSTISSNTGFIKLLRPEDCVKDRLAAYLHWNDRQSLEQAKWVATAQHVDLFEIEAWAGHEFNGEKLRPFLENLRTEINPGP